eukprot:2251910-Pleurochrysis_carterae.AAC.1
MVISNAIAARLTVAESASTNSINAQTAIPPPTPSRVNGTAASRNTVRPTDDAPAPHTDRLPDRVGPEPPDLQKHFQRGLGAYPLRNRTPTALLTVREASSNPDVHARNTGCAFVAHTSNADPKTRKQALRDDRAGWTAAER